MKVACPYCNCSSCNLYLNAQDHLVSHQRFNLHHCPQCDFLFTLPVPRDLRPYYDSPAYLSHDTDNSNLITILYNTVRNYQLKKKVSIIDTYGQGKYVLDYGCGTGQFIQACLKRDFYCDGIEPNEKARSKAINLTERNIYPSFDTLDCTSNYDLITFWHVLEHISQPWEILKKIKHLLKPNGCVVIALPNYNSHDAVYYGEYWAGYDVPRHLFHFSQRSISTLSDQLGFTLLETLPMKFDSFYVSLLSEANKNVSIMKYPNAFYRGLISNLHASRTGEYSSMIYILKNHG